MLDVSLHHTFPHTNPKRPPFVLQADFHLDRELVVLFGQSGCGKSSILNAIAGLLAPQRGCISLDGTLLFDSDRTFHLPPHRRPLGYVFQHAALFPHLNVADNISFALNHHTRRQRQLRVGELAAQLHLEELLERPVRHLSGGQAQRVAIARALAPQPKALLLDEPFSALDDALRYDLRRHLKRLQQDLKLPILLVTHSRGEAIELADRLIVIERGRITHIDTPERLLVERSRSVSSHFAWG